MIPEQRAYEVQQLRRDYPGWSIWYHRLPGYPDADGMYYAKPRRTSGPAATVTAGTASGLRATIAEREGL